MKYVSAVRELCKFCQIVKRYKAIYVVCKNNPKHKQKQGKLTGLSKNPMKKAHQ
jgi:large subunit ribosomal protein L36